ncbi:uncharacterized protein LOC120512104 [Passer montanus]|uniref:uncharacterized protein LOC120512104 n=1 Tax=Passer montanus TaxID=9160 RepID=UPI001960C95D|nr:uncharacterized protein LOC120512104 [Passer montanus]
MEIMILAKPFLLWNLLTNADPFFSLFTVAPPPAVVFPLLPSATAGRTHHRNPSTGGDRLPCARSRVYPDQSFLLCNPHCERHGGSLLAAPSCAAKYDQDVEEAFTQKCVYVCAGEWHFRRTLFPAASPARRHTAGSRPWLVSPLGYRHDRKQQRRRLRGWEGTHGEPSAKLAASPAAAVRGAPSAVRGRSAGQSGRGRARPSPRVGAGGTGGVPAGITPGSPRKMDSVRRRALSAALLLHQLSQ